MKKSFLFLVTLATGLSAFAGAVPITPTPMPDAGASLLLLSVGVSALSLFRKFAR